MIAFRYQKSNNGTFPSLNLTHKEVGGSFYTVREIVREIIQENRVLAPPKVSLEENGYSGFLEQHPLGSISMEPQIDLSVSDGVLTVTHILPDKYQISSEENISSSGGSYPLELDNEQIISGVSKVADKDEGSDRTSKSHHASNHYQDTSMGEVSNSIVQSPQPQNHDFEDEKIVNGIEVLDGSPHSDKPLTTNVDHQDNVDSAVLASEKFNGPASQRLSHEQYHNKNDQTVDKTKEFGQRIYTEPVVMETLDREKIGTQNVERSQAIKSDTNSDVVVETFPLRPVPRTIHNMDGESGKLQEAAGTLEDKAIQHDKKTFTQSSSGFVNEKGEEKLPDSTVELNGENRDEKVVLNLQGPSLENAKHPSASKPSVHDIGDIAELESMVSLPEGSKVSFWLYKEPKVKIKPVSFLMRLLVIS